MGYIAFDKYQLINLEYSLGREILRTNSAGSYASTTVINCNTRKYHGLLVTKQPQIDNHHHVFLSTLDATVIQRNSEFNLGIHKYQDNLYEPGGHKYAREFVADPIPKITYRVGGVVLSVEMVFADDEDRILLRYTLEDAHSPTKLRFKPMLAFRSVHSLSKYNEQANTSPAEVKNGIKISMYKPYMPVYMQFSKKPTYTHKPQWNYNVEYTKEKTRGYDYKEDLFNPGYFELPIKKGESIIFSAGFSDASNRKLNPLFDNEVDARIPRDNFINCLRNSASQFFLEQKGKWELVAGYHWFTVSGRDTFVALPGLTLPDKEYDLFLEVTDTMVALMKGPFFPINRINNEFLYNSVDAPLWFFWALQQFALQTGNHELIWKKYNKIMKKILEQYRNGTNYNIHMLENGLLYAGFDNDSLTWMNTRIDDKPVINRNGLAVEVNALWYNAIGFYTELSIKFGNSKVVNEWSAIIHKLDHAFNDTFWNANNGYLADVVKGEFKDMAVRPNQVIATSLPYSPLSEDMKYLILHRVQQELLTPRGLRTLSPKNQEYEGVYGGNILERDHAYHQGSVFPWLLGHFAEGYLRLHQRAGVSFVQRLFNEFEPEMTESGIGTISELYHGNPPHKGKGAISQAWSVAELLRINQLLNGYQTNTKQNK
ncbi:MAG: glycogen debranching enzyme family protein [Bacteroidales bacterium]|nr:glycogen debranching enzyme family protein [Bacteroidales bacterium]